MLMNNNKIIVIDDNNDHLDITKLVLERKGYEVRTLHGSENVLEAVKSYQPGLIFMDHNMPVYNGITATRLLKSDLACKHIPIIYFTSDYDIKNLAVEAGADDWLKKPFILEDLIRKTERFLLSTE